VASGVPETAAARIVGVSRVTVSRWVGAARRAGRPAPEPRPGRLPAITEAEEPTLLAQLAAMPNASLAEHCARWAREQGVRVSRTTMLRALARVRPPAGGSS
jgi:transposase